MWIYIGPTTSSVNQYKINPNLTILKVRATVFFIFACPPLLIILDGCTIDVCADGCFQWMWNEWKDGEFIGPIQTRASVNSCTCS